MSDPETRLNAACTNLTHAIDHARDKGDVLAEREARKAYEHASKALGRYGETPDKTRSYNE